MDFYALTGKMALGSRLRRLADNITSQAAKVYESYDVGIDPRWFPVFFMLTQKEQASISEIALDIGHSHPSVSQIVKEMTKNGITITLKSKEDSRVNVVKLSKKGKELQPLLAIQCQDVEQAIEKLVAESDSDLWQAIEQTELKLSENDFYQRVRNERKDREKPQVEIFDFSEEYKADFSELNKQWILKYWQLEQADLDALDSPQEYILDKGGVIYLASYNNEIVGSCALLKMSDDVYELAKMAVSDKAKGKGIGVLLGKRALLRAHERKAKKVYLESNTRLEPAINLYKKLGFKQISGVSSPYERCNIQMELVL
jgi:N-acetylglutamate synthase-like GNAT family acetyltransferase/DNA-binding MarR family transcriptional regulator